MCTNQKWVDWDFMSKYEPLHALLSKIEEAGLRNAMTLQHNWSEAVIKQFFPTLEVNYEKETIKWMTGRGKYKTSFEEFADVCQLDYHTMKEGTDG